MSDDQRLPEVSNKRRMSLPLAADGLPLDDVPYFIADEAHLRSYTNASEALSRFKAPVLFDRTDPHSHLIVALMDGTGNDIAQDAVHVTNVGRVIDQVMELKRSGKQRIHFEYTEGPGTQSNPLARSLDGALGGTSLERAELTYDKVVKGAQSIFDADPSARLSLHLEGFSRGASQVPLLARMIEDRGIPDFLSATQVRNADGELHTVYSRYHQPPGKTPMSVGLYDPVPTGYMELMDRRLPPSVVSGFQISAANERRGLFPVDQILPQGHSADGRFLHVTVAGAHSDIGGSYLRDGLGVRSFNLMTDYHNALLGEPLLQRLHEPQDPRLNVVHHSEHGNMLFRVAPKVDRATVAGQVHQLVADPSWHSPHGTVVDLPPQMPEPLAVGMEKTLVRQPVARGADPVPPSLDPAESLKQRLAAQQVELRPYQPALVQRPHVRALGALGALGAAGTLYEASQVQGRINLLHGQSNPEGASSEQRHFMSRGLGGWSGGSAAGLALGSVSGPVALGFIAYGSLVGDTLGEKLAERWDQHRIFNQTDREGVAWSYNGSQWLREELADLSDAGSGNGDAAGTAADPRPQQFSAQLEKAAELNYRASNVAAALAMGEVPRPRDPYTLPANDADRSSLRPADWRQDASTTQWSRVVAIGYQEKNLPLYERVYASPERAAELDRQSAQIVESNVAESRAAIAARYEAVYTAQDWQRHGEMPSAVRTALDPDALVASDGRQYQRDAQGKWHEGERVATENLQRELDATHAVLQPALALHHAQVAAIQPPAPLDSHAQERANLAATYLQHGVQPFPETLDAVLDAVEKTRAAHGIPAGTTSLALEPRQDGTWDVHSPIAHLQRIDGVVVKAAVTSTAELQEALLAREVVPSVQPVDQALSPTELPTAMRARAASVEPPGREDIPDLPLSPTREEIPDIPLSLTHASHPDHTLYEQIRQGVATLDAEHGRTFDALSERMSASLLVLAKANDLDRVDHVLVSTATRDKPAGHTLFLVNGALDDPLHKRASMPTAQAAQTPVEASMQQLEEVSQQAQQRALADQQAQPLRDDPSQQGLQAHVAAMN